MIIPYEIVLFSSPGDDFQMSTFPDDSFQLITNMYYIYI